MTLQPYSTHIVCSKTGMILFPDYDCEVSVSYDRKDGWEIDDVRKDGKSLFKGDAFAQQIGAIVANIAERELDAGGWLYRQVVDKRQTEAA